MADFTQTITNAVRCFGQGPSSKWNEYAWNAFQWGEGTTAIGKAVVHLLDMQTVSPSDGFAGKRVFHLLDAQTVVSDVALYRSYAYTVTESVTAGADMYSEGLSDGSGYQYVFADRTTEGESRASASWTQGTASSSTWSTALVASTTWSEA